MDKLQLQLNNLEKNYKNHNHDGVNSFNINHTSFISTILPNTDPATGANYGIFFIAPKTCKVISAQCVFTTAGTNGSDVTLQIEKLTGTTAPDSGTDMLETAFNLKGTANTVQSGVLLKGRNVALNTGDRLCLKDSGTLTAVAGLCVTVQLEYQ